MLLYLDWDTHRNCLVGLRRCLLGVLPDATIFSILSGKTCLVSLVAVYIRGVG